MKFTRLFLVRHGETEYNKKGMMQGRGIDAPLNDTGHRQAQLIAENLESEGPDVIVSSGMIRAIETARPLSEKLSKPIHSFSELDEMNFGDFEGQKSSNIQKELKQLHDTWAKGEVNVPIPGGESPVEVYERADGRIRTLLNEGSNETKVFFLHGRLIRILLSKWLGYGLQNMHKVEHQNGAINHILKNHVSFNVVYLNKTDHLRELL
jgi:probable phosphoglycerate mutase